MILAATVLVFVTLLLLSVPIVFCLGAAAVIGLLLGGYPLQQLGSSMTAASQSWVLLAIPSFIFAGSLMERAGMSNSLVELARSAARTYRAMDSSVRGTFTTDLAMARSSP